VTKGDPTATEVAQVSQASGVRLDDMHAAVFEAIRTSVGHLAGLLIANKDLYADRSFPAGDPRSPRFAALDDQVVGQALDYQYDMVVSATERVDRNLKQKRIENLIGQSIDPALAQKLQSEGWAFKTAPLLRRHLRELGETNPDAFFSELAPPPGMAGAPGTEDPAAKAQAEDQQMVQTGEPAPVLPTDDHAAEMAVHQADYQQTGSEAIGMHLAMHEQMAGEGTGNREQGTVGLPAAPAGAGPDQAAAMQAAMRGGLRQEAAA